MELILGLILYLSLGTIFGILSTFLLEEDVDPFIYGVVFLFWPGAFPLIFFAWSIYTVIPWLGKRVERLSLTLSHFISEWWKNFKEK
jgi:hypothetical protein